MTIPENQPREFTILVDSGSDTSQGRKKPNNEDYVLSHEPNDRRDLEYSGCLYIVSDGVGGAKRGEKASKYAAEKVLFEYYQHPEQPPAERLRTILRDVGNEILDYSTQAGLGKMATTLVAAVVRGDRLLVANVGDSRAYLIRNDSVEMLTVDHNQLSELLRSGAMTEEEGRRSKVGNILTRSIGGHEDVVVDVFPERKLQPGDRIVLCSDGLHRYLDDAALGDMARPGSAQEAAQRMVVFANQAGGADNISALVVSVHAQGEALPHTRAARIPEQPPALDLIKTDVPKFRGRRLPKRTFRTEYLLFAAPVIALMMIVGLLGSRFFRQSGAQTPTLETGQILVAVPSQTQTADLPVEPPPVTQTPLARPAVTLTPETAIALVEETPGPEVQPTGPVEAAATVTATQPALPTQTESPERRSCVHQAVQGGGISQILQKFEQHGVRYDRNKTYTFFRRCDLTAKTCAQSVVVPSADHDSFTVREEYYLLIDEINDSETCEMGAGIWVVLE